ncbi:hypothetical protein TRVL_01951 [Trypanosoma vivax]|nr:hypothetical protein TRVL_01951 [Trypanosoma vivax]
MLREWLRGKQTTDSQDVEAPKRRSALEVDVETPIEPTQEEIDAQHAEAFRKKLAASAKEGPQQPGSMVSYEVLLRNSQRLLMEGNGGETQEGLTVNLARNAQNVMISTKTHLISPQMSNWELSLQMNGFSDVVVAAYSSLSRWSLMYQRVSSTGALLFAQCMAQRQQGVTQGTLVGMLQYPWVHGGCTQVQYVKDQTFSLSHVQRLIRGLYIGSNFAWDAMSKGTSLSHAFSCTNPAKTASLAAEWSPTKGDWRLALTRSDWASDAEFAMQIERARKGSGALTNVLSFGTKKKFVGGGSLSAVLSGFARVKALVELPFGGECSGINQMMCSYSVQYDIISGALKHGISFTL